ncbi:MAG: hypothetical protein FWE62_02145 [Firmicutes bacterium]|nr:hypothetical protein [Bacillota bacterium]
MTHDEKIYYEELFGLIAERSAAYGRAAEAQIAVWEGGVPDEHPLLLRCGFPSGCDFPSYNPGEVHHDRAKMLLAGMRDMLSAALGDAQAVPSARANMGCGIFPSLFPGIAPLLFDDGKMPWVKQHLDRDTIVRLRESDIKITDEFKIALEHTAYIAEHIRGTGAYAYPPDLQGPFDTAHIVYGDAIFYDIYDDPAFMHHLMDLSCYAIELGFSECLKVLPGSESIVAHYNDVVLPRSRGGLKISEDTSTLLSSGHIDEYVTPYTRRVLERFGGGYIHYCGKNDYLLEQILQEELICGLNFGNPNKHDMDDVLRRTAQAGKVFYGWIPKPKDESLPDYFGRLRRAATADGKCRLLLQYSAPYEMREEVLDAWRYAK